MDYLKFWKIIKETKPKKEDEKAFQKRISRLSIAERLKAQAILNKYDEMLGNVLNQEEVMRKYQLTDDGYLDFKRWVISKGYDIYKIIYNGNLDIVKNYITDKHYIADNFFIPIGIDYETFSFIYEADNYYYEYEMFMYNYSILTKEEISVIERSVQI